MAISAFADEGMWLFEDLPLEHLKQKYEFQPTAAWKEHVMLSSVRFNSGGSASFVSSRGLVLTNHHVAADTLQKLSTPKNNYLEDGFLASSHAEELKSPDLELNQLVSISDVTDRVNKAVSASHSSDEAYRARRAVMAQIEKEALDESGLRSDVVTLFGGAKYHLYRYKKYTDVRLVWAPESRAAFFGGDADNFEYPRYNLDVALFRVYENGIPVPVEHFLKMSECGAQEEELVLVSGNPGRTRRSYTIAALKQLRDRRLPRALDLFRRREVLLQQFGLEGAEQRRRAQKELFSVQNRRKAYTGMLAGLSDPGLIAAKQTAEKSLRAEVQGRELHYAIDAWDKIAGAQARVSLQENRLASLSHLSRYYRLAEKIVLMTGEDEKPSDERLREFRSSARKSLEHDLFSPAPIYDDLEQAKLADALAYFAQLRGGDDPLVTSVLAGLSPVERAARLIQGTRLKEVAQRRQLAAGGSEAVARSSDPMIRLVRLIEPEYRRNRQVAEEAAEVKRQAYGHILTAKVAIEGTSDYPDATFTLRLAFGVVRGYVENRQVIPPWTTLGGAYDHQERHGGKDAWRLPVGWHQHRKDVDLAVPLNFICTVDIVGGNSGSPVINRAGELVGVIFDGNIQSLTADYLYSEKVSRAVAVHSTGIRESLRNIYGAGDLADELGQ
ncbi:MAG: S46 family peptidase [Pirellulales bacterium]|nr:S46 family peptidase [Pirellulales bacterium]